MYLFVTLNTAESNCYYDVYFRTVCSEDFVCLKVQIKLSQVNIVYGF